VALTIRRATIGDAASIAAVQIATWRVAYAGLVPNTHLDALSLERRSEIWRGLISGNAADDKRQTATWVAIDAGGSVIGFADAGPTRDTDAVGRTGELRAIYVLPSSWGTGVGHALHDRTVRWLRRRGYPSASLWVLVGNERARRFYERHGWRAEGTRAPIVLAGGTATEIRYQLDLTVRGDKRTGQPPPTGPVGGS
jgi:GNAT superfamily N-acetyltransferase